MLVNELCAERAVHSIFSLLMNRDHRPEGRPLAGSPPVREDLAVPGVTSTFLWMIAFLDCFGNLAHAGRRAAAGEWRNGDDQGDTAREDETRESREFFATWFVSGLGCLSSALVQREGLGARSDSLITGERRRLESPGGERHMSMGESGLPDSGTERTTTFWRRKPTHSARTCNDGS